MQTMPGRCGNEPALQTRLRLMTSDIKGWMQVTTAVLLVMLQHFAHLSFFPRTAEMLTLLAQADAYGGMPVAAKT